MYVHIQAKGTSLENCYSRLVLFDCYNADYVNWFCIWFTVINLDKGI